MQLLYILATGLVRLSIILFLRRFSKDSSSSGPNIIDMGTNMTISTTYATAMGLRPFCNHNDFDLPFHSFLRVQECLVSLSPRILLGLDLSSHP